jgi:hypothetical protein
MAEEMNHSNSTELGQEEIPSKQTETVTTKEGWIIRHSQAVVAFTALGSLITTFFLALFAYESLKEVKTQRNLASRQFIIANAPSVRTYVTKGFEFSDDQGWMIWEAVNKGGPVHEVEFKSIVLCCGNDIKNQESTNLVVRTIKRHRLNRDEKFLIRIGVKRLETLTWLKDAVEGNSSGLFVYVHAKYTIPEALSLKGRAEEDTTYTIVTWIPATNRFENTTPQTQAAILQLIDERGYLLPEEEQ